MFCVVGRPLVHNQVESEVCDAPDVCMVVSIKYFVVLVRLVDHDRDCASVVHMRAVVIVEFMFNSSEHPILVLIRLLVLCPQQILIELDGEDLNLLLVA